MQAETYEVKLDDFFKTTIEKMELLGATRLNKSRTDFIQCFVNVLIVSRSVQFTEVASKMTGHLLRIVNIDRFNVLLVNITLIMNGLAY